MNRIEPLEPPEPMDETALLRRRQTILRCDVTCWTIGVEWHPERTQLVLRPFPCVAFDVHLPGRSTRVGVRRWFRARAFFFTMTIALSLATTLGFLAGRILSPAARVVVPAPSAVVVPAAESRDEVRVIPAPTLPLPATVDVATPPLETSTHATSQYERFGVPPWEAKPMATAPAPTASVRRLSPRTPDPYDSRF